MEHHITTGRHHHHHRNNNSDDDAVGSSSSSSSSSSSYYFVPSPPIIPIIDDTSTSSSSSSTTTKETYASPPSRSKNFSRNKRRKLTSDSLEKHHHDVEDCHSDTGSADRDQQRQYHHDENPKHRSDENDHTYHKDGSSTWQSEIEEASYRERMQEERLVLFPHHDSSNAFAAATEIPSYRYAATTATSSTTASTNGCMNKICPPSRSRPIGKIVFVTKSKTIKSPRDISSSLQSSYPQDSRSVQKSQPQVESHRYHRHRRRHVDEVHVEIVSLFVRKDYRGQKLGKMLFNEMVNMLRRRYSSRSKIPTTTAKIVPAVSSNNTHIRITLDAEEDVRCYNRLVNFYRDLGCTVIRVNSDDDDNDNNNNNNNTIGNNAGKKTTYPGGDVRQNKDIRVANTNQQNLPSSSINERFVYSSTGDVCYRRVPMELNIDISDQGDSCRDYSHRHRHHRHPDQEVNSHTNFRSMYSSTAPLYDHRPPSLIEDRASLSFVPYAFLSSALDLAPIPRDSQESMTLEDLLLHAKKVPVKFSREMPDLINSDLSLRMVCFQLAELARDAGHPDWFQFTAMICCLGSILRRNHETYEKKNGLTDMVEILKNSSIGLPEESFNLLRSFFVYVEACGNGNASMKSGSNLSPSMVYPSSVMDLYEIIHLAQMKMVGHDLKSQRPTRSVSQSTEAAATTTTVLVVSESHCDELWEEYYSFVAMKYDARKYLKW